MTCQDQKSVSTQGNIFPRDIFKLSWGGRGPLLSFIFNLYSFISFLFFDFQSFLVHLSFKTLSLKTIFCRLVIDSFSATHPNITSFWRFGQNSIISPETPASDQTYTPPPLLRKSLKRKSNKCLSSPPLENHRGLTDSNLPIKRKQKGRVFICFWSRRLVYTGAIFNLKINFNFASSAPKVGYTPKMWYLKRRLFKYRKCNQCYEESWW